MKINSETRLLLFMAFFVLGGGAFLLLSSRPPAPPPSPPPTVDPATSMAELLKNVRHSKGDPAAPLTIVEFADFECPSCRRAYESVLSGLDEKKARLVFRHFPLPDHETALPAALAVEAASRQNKFWPMYEALFDPAAPALTDAFLVETARKIGLDIARFDKDRIDPALEAVVEADQALAQKHGISSTPTFFVQNKSGVSRAVGGDELKTLLARLSAPAATSTASRGQ